MEKVIVGLDIGTSSVKVAAFNMDGHLLASASVAVPLYSPFPGWAEQEPQDWWSASCYALRQVLQNIDSKQVAALGLCGQCPGHVIVDAAGNSIGRAIIWRDQRAQEEAHWLAESIPGEKAHLWVGKNFLGEATLPPARLLWMKRHAVKEMETCEVILQAKDFVGLKLTGIAATDVNSAYCLYNPQTERYETDYFAALGLPVKLMPTVLQPTEVLGTVTRSASLVTGLPEGVVVICGTIDAYCDNLAAGAILPGCAVDVAGTSEVVSLGVKKANDGSEAYLASIGETGHFLCGPTQSGGNTLCWLRQAFYPEFNGQVNFGILEQDASAISAGTEGLIFLPYLNGERAPIWDSQIRGGFVGLSLVHHRGHFTRAVYEGVGYSVRHILEIFEKMSGKQAKSVTVCGGGSKSTFWNQIKADILQRPVSVMEISQTGCLGAAMLASLGIGTFPDVKIANRQMMHLRVSLDPAQANAQVYDDAYHRYRSLYPALKPLFQENEG